MLRWLIDGEEEAGNQICSDTCRGELEVMESRLLMSVNAISRMVGVVEGDDIVEDADLSGWEVDDGGALWI